MRAISNDIVELDASSEAHGATLRSLRLAGENPVAKMRSSEYAELCRDVNCKGFAVGVYHDG